MDATEKIDVDAVRECSGGCDAAYKKCIANGTQTGGCYFTYCDCADNCAPVEHVSHPRAGLT